MQKIEQIWSKNRLLILVATSVFLLGSSECIATGTGISTAKLLSGKVGNTSLAVVKKATATPKPTPTPIPKRKATPTPKKKATPTPKKKATPTPKKKATPTPAPKRTPAAKTQGNLSYQPQFQQNQNAASGNRQNRNFQMPAGEAITVTGTISQPDNGGNSRFAMYLLKDGTHTYILRSRDIDLTSYLGQKVKVVGTKRTTRPRNSPNPNFNADANGNRAGNGNWNGSGDTSNRPRVSMPANDGMISVDTVTSAH